MADDRKLERTVRIGAAVFDPTDKTAADRLAASLTPKQGRALQERGALSGDDWEFSGTQETMDAMANSAGTGMAGGALEPEGSPARREQQRQAAAAGSNTTQTSGLADMTRRELEAEFQRRRLDLNDVTGTGSNGNVVNRDLVTYLESNPGTPDAGTAPDTGPAGAGTPNPADGSTGGDNPPPAT